MCRELWMDWKSDGAKINGLKERRSDRWTVTVRDGTLSLRRSSLRRSFAPSIAPYTITLFFLFLIYRLIAPSLFALSLCPSVAPSLHWSLFRRSFVPLLFSPSLFRSIHSSLHNYSFFFFLFSILIYRLIALSLFDPLICCSVAPLLCPYVALSLRSSIHLSLNRSITPPETLT